jgi:hypothetical protein
MCDTEFLYLFPIRVDILPRFLKEICEEYFLPAFSSVDGYENRYFLERFG